MFHHVAQRLAKLRVVAYGDGDPLVVAVAETCRARCQTRDCPLLHPAQWREHAGCADTADRGLDLRDFDALPRRRHGD